MAGAAVASPAVAAAAAGGDVYAMSGCGSGAAPAGAEAPALDQAGPRCTCCASALRSSPAFHARPAASGWPAGTWSWEAAQSWQEWRGRLRAVSPHSSMSPGRVTLFVACGASAAPPRPWRCGAPGGCRGRLPGAQRIDPLHLSTVACRWRRHLCPSRSSRRACARGCSSRAQRFCLPKNGPRSGRYRDRTAGLWDWERSAGAQRVDGMKSNARTQCSHQALNSARAVLDGDTCVTRAQCVIIRRVSLRSPDRLRVANAPCTSHCPSG